MKNKDLKKWGFVVVDKVVSPTNQTFVLGVHDNGVETTPVLAADSCAPEFFNLLSASRVMYGALDSQQIWLEQLLELCGQLKIDSGVVDVYEQMLENVKLAKECAERGLNNVAQDKINEIL